MTYSASPVGKVSGTYGVPFFVLCRTRYAFLETNRELLDLPPGILRLGKRVDPETATRGVRVRAIPVSFPKISMRYTGFLGQEGYLLDKNDIYCIFWNRKYNSHWRDKSWIVMPFNAVGLGMEANLPYLYSSNSNIPDSASMAHTSSLR